ncbi:winged helix-turn-helix domain-containing protein [Staphylococcus aureus]
MSHAQLLRTVWGPAHENQIDYLRIVVRGLRLKLEADPADAKLIRNEPGVGYRLSV